MTMKKSEESGKGSSSVVSHKETSPSCKELCDEIIKVWALVEIDTLEEQDLEGFIDLVPSGWITSGKRFSWYPMGHHKSSIEKLAKMGGEADPKWDCFPMAIIEDGIGNFLQDPYSYVIYLFFKCPYFDVIFSLFFRSYLIRKYFLLY